MKDFVTTEEIVLVTRPLKVSLFLKAINDW